MFLNYELVLYMRRGSSNARSLRHHIDSKLYHFLLFLLILPRSSPSSCSFTVSLPRLLHVAHSCLPTATLFTSFIFYHLDLCFHLIHFFAPQLCPSLVLLSLLVHISFHSVIVFKFLSFSTPVHPALSLHHVLHFSSLLVESVQIA